MSDRDLQDNLVDQNTAVKNIPYSVKEAEMSVLALCMRNKDAVGECVGKRLVPEDFADPRNGVIFSAIRELYVSNQDVNRILVCKELREKKLIDKAGSDSYVFDVANMDSVMSALDDYISVVTSNCQTRKVVNTLEKNLDSAKKQQGTVNNLIETAVAQLNALKINDDEETAFELLAPILKRNLAEIVKLSQEGSDRRTVKTGFPHLDKLTGGFRPGTFNIIAARPAMGKTALALNMAANVAGMYSKTVAIFSLEMSKKENANRLLASLSQHTNADVIINPHATKEQLEDLEKTVEMMSPLKIWIDDKANTNPVEIMNKCKNLMSKTEVSLIIIDHLGLLTYPGRNDGRQNEVAAIARSLKVLAKELNIPVVALAQLNRGTEKRDQSDEDRIPGLADIRESGAIEQDADCVIFIHRPDYYLKGKREKKEIEDAQLIVAKNRHGATDTVYVKWIPSKTRFFEPDHKSDPQDPQQSAYTRTTSSDSASSDFHFDDNDIPPEEVMDEPVYDDTYPDNPGNEELFGDDTHDGFPEGF